MATKGNQKNAGLVVLKWLGKTIDYMVLLDISLDFDKKLPPIIYSRHLLYMYISPTPPTSQRLTILLPHLAFALRGAVNPRAKGIRRPDAAIAYGPSPSCWNNWHSNTGTDAGRYCRRRYPCSARNSTAGAGLCP